MVATWDSVSVQLVGRGDLGVDQANQIGDVGKG